MPFRLRAPLNDNLVIQFTAFRRKVLREARKATASRVYRTHCAGAGCLLTQISPPCPAMGAKF